MNTPESSLLPRVLLGAAGAAVSLGASSAQAALITTTPATPLTITGQSSGGNGAIYFDPVTGFAVANTAATDSTAAFAEPTGSSNANYNFSLGYGAAGNAKGASRANHPIFTALTSGSQVGQALGFQGQTINNQTPFIAPRLATGQTVSSTGGGSGNAFRNGTSTLHDNNTNDPNAYQWNSGATGTADTNGYLGFSFVGAGGVTMYGYANVTYAAGTEAITLNSFAYENTGGPAVITSVPEPGSLAAAATLGAAGLLAYRRRKAAR